MTDAQKEFISKLTLLKNEAMAIGLYRTGRMIEIPIIEIGWELQGAETPDYQKKRQQETLTPWT